MKPTGYNTVMVVDDNEIDRYIAGTVITRSGYATNVINMEGARQALTYLERYMNEPELLPEVIFVDINMPELSGFDFLERYNEFPEELKRNCIIMMLTSSIDVKDLHKANNDANVAMFLNKPLNRESLKQMCNLSS